MVVLLWRARLHPKRLVVRATSKPPARAADKRPYAFRRKDDQPIVFAGLWESWKAETGKTIRTFAIITTEANADMAPLHDRMPVILEPTDWPVWLGEEPGDQAVLLYPAPDGLLEMWPIGRAVNSPRNNGPELLEQVGL
jgi:putative SOS response-associated peptidase YedK